MKFKPIDHISTSLTIDPSYIMDDVINKLNKPINATIDQDLGLFWKSPEKNVVVFRWVVRFLIPSNQPEKYAGRFDFFAEIEYQLINEDPSDDIEQLIKSSYAIIISEFKNQKEFGYFYEPPQISQDTIDNYQESFQTLLEEV